MDLDLDDRDRAGVAQGLLGGVEVGDGSVGEAVRIGWIEPGDPVVPAAVPN